MRAAKALFENHQRLGYVQGSPIRDHYITSADVYNIKLELDKETWRRHANDRISTELWMKANSSQVVLYQAPKSDPFKPLRLAVTRPLLLDWLLKHGNGGCVAIDGTHGTQKYKVIFYYHILMFLSSGFHDYVYSTLLFAISARYLKK